MHIDIQSALNVVFGVLTVSAAVVKLLGKENTRWGQFILKVGNDFLPHRSPPNAGDSGPPTQRSGNHGQPSSGLMLAGAAAIAMACFGCGGGLQQTLKSAETVATIVQTILTGIRATVDSYYTLHPAPAAQAHLDDLIADVATADEAVQRLATGKDAVPGGEIAVAVAKLQDAYGKLLLALRDAGVVAPAMGAGASGYRYLVGVHAGAPVPELPAVRGAS